MKVFNLLLIAGVMLGLRNTGYAQSLTFIEPHMGRNGSYATAVSDDGNAVAGCSVNITGIQTNWPSPDGDWWGSQRAFRWTRSGGTQDLGTLGWDRTWANSISADGQTVVGASRIGDYAWRAFRWTPSSGMVDLGSLGIDWVDALDVSSDGSVVVGYSYGSGPSGWGVYGFRWTPSTGMVNLGALAGYRFTHALAVSADGAIVVGEANLDWAPYWNNKQAWRWTAATGIVGLGVPTGWDSSVALGISADGSTIIGLLHSGRWDDDIVDPYRAFRWRADTGFQDLGTLGGDRTYVRFAVNRDGTVIYGASQLANGEWRAFRWTASTCIQDLNTLYAGAIPSGWVLRNASDCSSDGRYVVGWAQGPGGVVRGFLLDTGVSSNRPPAVPTLIAPAHNARVSSLPAFQLRASDPDGDRVRFEVQVWQGSDVRTFSVPASGFVPSDQVASGTPPQPLPAGTWRWKARTWDQRGGVSSWSGERVFQVQAGELNPPTNLQAQALSSTQIRLTWQDNSPDETGFEIQRRHQNATSFATIATVRAGQTSYTDWALAPATTYVYRVRAVDTVQGRVSAWSNEASATTLGDLPAAPSDLRAQALSGSQVLLTWRDNSNNEQGFEIQRAPVSTGVYQTLTRVAANVTSYIDRQGLQPDTEYRYRVRAYNAAGSSDWSNEASARTLSNIDFSSYRFIKANLHSHTNYSDGRESIEDAWRYCLLKLLAITDHAEQLTLDEWNAIQDFADSRNGNVWILRGFEWTKTCCDDSCWTGFWCSIWSGIGLSRIRGDGHINVFNTQNRVGAYFTSDLTQNDIRDTLDSFYAWLVEADRNERFFSDVPVIAQFNHPTLYEYITRFRDFRLPEGNREQLREIFALMEVGSHCGLGCYHNTEANEGWYRFALNRGWRVAPTNNQDNHLPLATAKTKPFTGILLPSDIASSPASMRVQQECLRALSKRRTYASEDKNSTILMAARLPGDTGWSYLMGDVITLPSSGFGQLTLAISAKNPKDSLLNTRDYIQRVELIAPRGQIISQDSFNEGVSEVLFEVRLSEEELRSLPRTDLGEIYIYAKMVQADGDIVLSAPIWIKFIDGQFVYDRRNQPPVEGECDQPVEPFEIKLLEEEPVGLEEEPVGLEEPFPVKGGSSDGHGH